MFVPLLFTSLQILCKISYLYYLFVLLEMILSIFLAITNVIVYREAKQQYEKIISTTVAENETEQKKKIKELNKRKWKSTRTLITIVLTTNTLLIPMNILTVVLIVYRKVFWKYCFSKHLVYAAAICTHVNAFKDPLLYVLTNRHLKKKMYQMFNNIRMRININYTPGSSTVEPSTTTNTI